MKKKYSLVIILWFMSTLFVLAQEQRVKGKVSAADGVGMPGVTVVNLTANVTASTNGEGLFEVPGKVGDRLRVSYVGYLVQQIAVANYEFLNIILEAETDQIEEVVVIGYGTQSKRTVTSAISKLDGKSLIDKPIVNAGEGMKGKVAGAHIYTTNNSPGSDVTIRIRGGSSINRSNEPLVLIDGVERNLGSVNPQDIESIEILKDATSAAIYGSRASNGVVLVTTKRGAVNNAPQFLFEASNAVQSLERTYKYLNAEDYLSIVRPAVAKSKEANTNFLPNYSHSSANGPNSIYSTRHLQPGEQVPAGYKSMADPLDPSKTLIFQDNSFKDLIYNTANLQNYYLGVNGGSEHVAYNASIGYTDDQGVAISTGYKRFSGQANADIRVNEKLKITTGINYSNNLLNEFISQYQVITRGLATPAVQKVYYEDGTPTPGYNRTSPSPVFYDYYNDADQKRDVFTLNGGLDYTIFSDLKFNFQASLFKNMYQADYFERANVFNGNRNASTNFKETVRNRYEGYFSYNKRISQHSISAMLGASIQDFKSKNVVAEANGASSDKIPSLNAGPNKSNAYSYFENERLLSMFGRVMYDYEKKYMLMATFRNDGSSRFAVGNQWGFFPGISAGWVVSEEDFMQSHNIFSEVKLRSSYGQTGNNAIGYYDALGLYSVNARYDSQAAIVASAMANQTLTWETSTQLDLGLDLSTKNNRVSLSIDYFNKITNNLLFSKVLPNTSGFSSVLTNVGKVKFHGFEVDLNTTNITRDNFSWTSSFTYSYVKNKVLALPDNGNDKNRIGGFTVINPDGTSYQVGGIAEGEPLYRYYGYVTDGILENLDQANAARFDELSRGFRIEDGLSIPGRKSVGDYEWKDRNGDGRINAQDQFYLGNMVPHSTGGISNTFNYKNFTLNVFMDYAIGHSINDNVMSRYFTGIFANNFQLVDEVKQTWKQPGDNTKYARYTANDSDAGNRNFRTASNVFNYKGDFLSLREVSLQYLWNGEILKKANIQSIQFTLGGYNLHYFTAIKGMSPEFGTNNPYASNFATHPPIKRISFGAKLIL